MDEKILSSYHAWCAHASADPDLARELAAMAQDEAALSDAFYRDLAFGTGGLRGVIAAGTNRMNIYVVRRATQGLADYLKTFPGGPERGVAIAYDSRHMSDVFAKETALVLAQNGIKAYLYSTLHSVPQLSFTVLHLNCMAGVVITASHNPPEYNGYKVYWQHGGQAGPEQASEILGYIRKADYFKVKPMEEGAALESGLLNMIGEEVDEAYYKATMSLRLAPEVTERHGAEMRIVYTPLHGSGNVPVREILKRIGLSNISVVKEQEAPDGSFPTVKAPNPEDPNAFTLAFDLANKTGADLILGTDPDSDRLGAAVRGRDGWFQVLTGNQIGSILIHYILSTRSERGTLPKDGLVVRSIVSTRMADAICAYYGVELREVLTGFRFISEQIAESLETKEHTFLFGFEESYGFLSGTDVRDKDGVNAVMLIAEAACYYKKMDMTLVDAIEELYKEFGTFGERTVSIVLPGKDGLEKMQTIMQTLRAEGVEKVGPSRVMSTRDYMMSEPKSDVLYYVLEQGWACVRPSGTEPKIKTYFTTKGKDLAEAEAKKEELAAAVKPLLA